MLLQKVDFDVAGMVVVDHIREFRNRLIVCVVVFVILFTICFSYAAPLVTFFQIPSQGLYDFIYISPSELFMQYIRVGLIAGLVFSSPVIIYELLAFVSPGLKPKEKTFMIGILLLGVVFFILGVIFAFEIMLPIMLTFFNNINGNAGIVAQISIKEYLNLVISILGMMGLIFEMPIVSILLSEMGFLKPEWLRKFRRVVIVLCFVLAAVLTPPDVVSQILLGVPMILLYQVAIWFCASITKRKARQKAKREEERQQYRYH